MRKSHLYMPFGVTGSYLVALALASGPAIAQAPGDVEIEVRELPAVPAEPQAVPGEIIVKMRPGMAAEQVLPATDLVALGVRSAPRVTSGGELVFQLTPQAMFALRSEEAAMARMGDLAAQLSARPEVEYAQPNWILRPSLTPNDPLYPLQWHYRNNGSGSEQSPGGINLPNAWDTVVGDAAVVVAVLDTGILPAQADIAGSPNLAAGFDMITDAFIANDGDGATTIRPIRAMPWSPANAAAISHRPIIATAGTAVTSPGRSGSSTPTTMPGSPARTGP